MAANIDIKQAIIDSVFSRRNASGGPEESYISHVKVWEDAGPEAGELKHRYILLARMSIATLRLYALNGMVLCCRGQ